MGRNFSQRPSHLLQIEDDKLAYDFDRCCNIRLQIYDIENEKRRLEAMSMGGLGAMFHEKPKDKPMPEGSF